MKKVKKKILVREEPRMEDFYDSQDPRGISSTEFNEYQAALDEYNKPKKKKK